MPAAVRRHRAPAPVRHRCPRSPLLRRSVGGVPLAPAAQPDPLGRQERPVGDLPPRRRLAHLPQPGALLGCRRRAAAGRRADVDHLDGRPRAHPAAAPHQPRLHPAKVRALTDHLRELSNEIIDQVADRGRLDFVEELAIHVPLIVIAELMGLDPDQRSKLYKWSDAMMAGDSATDPDDPVLHAAAEAFGEYATTCLGLIEERRSDPGRHDDLIGILTQAFDDGALARDDLGGATPESGGDRREHRRGAHRRRAHHVPRAHRGGRQRDHAQRPHRRPAGVLAVPGAEAPRDRGPVTVGHRRRRAHPVRVAGAVVLAAP